MSKKANPTAIGAFTVAGLGLALVGLILFSSSRLFSDTESYILYFDEDLGGLEVGAPVKFRGITIGEVKQALIRFNQGRDDLFMPVIVELNAELLGDKSDQTVEIENRSDYENAIKKGLRAKLETENLLTGRLYVNLAFITNATQPVYHQQSTLYKEIPTVPTDISRFLKNLASIDVREITDSLQAVLTNLNTKIDALQVDQLSAGLTNLFISMETLVNSPELTNALSSASGAFVELKALSAGLRGKVDPLATSAEQVLREASVALEEIRAGVQGLNDSLAPQGPLQREAVETLDELGRAARSVTGLADYLKQNPNALISGKKLRTLTDE